jgi:hypothetical protein
MHSIGPFENPAKMSRADGNLQEFELDGLRGLASAYLEHQSN